MLPLTTRRACTERRLPVPADPERLLAATYGDGWRVPDPSFRYDTPRWMSRRFGGWFGGLMTDRKHWDAFYAEGAGVPRNPSPFALWVAEQPRPTGGWWTWGRGPGATRCGSPPSRARRVTALDYSVRATQRTAPGRQAPRPPAEGRRDQLLRPARGPRHRGAAQPDQATRGSLRSVPPCTRMDEVGRDNVVRLASMALRRGGLLFLEFRTPEDASRPHAFGNHRRYYLAPDDVVARIEAAGGRVVAREEGTGLAPIEGEDPVVCRLVASWSGQDA